MDTFPIIAFLALALLIAGTILFYVLFTLLKRMLVLERSLAEMNKNVVATSTFLRSILLTALVTQQGVNTILSMLPKKEEPVSHEEAHKEGVKIH